MGRTQRNYEKEYKEQAVKLAKEIGTDKAARELGVPKGTLSGWLKAVREGRLEAGPGSHTPESAMSLVEQMAQRQGVTEQLKASDQMAWASRMNNIRASAMEVVDRKIVYA